MQQPRSIRGSSTSRLVTSAALFVLAGCDAPEDPGAGQTGSPVVPPDHESPVPFRPPPEVPPGGGATPELPSRPLTPPDRMASFGAWLYVTNEDGLSVFDTSAPRTGRPTARLLPGATPRWIGVDGAALNVIASALPDDPAAVERGPLTRLYRFDLASDPAHPELLGSVELPGVFYQARLEAGRLVSLSAEFPALTCSPGLGFSSGAFAPDRLIVTDYQLAGASWAVASELGVEADGFIETDAAFVLTHGGYFGEPAELSVVELGAGALTGWPSINLGGEVLPRAAMAVARQRLALFQDTDNGTELRVYGAPGAEPASLPVAVPPQAQEGDGIDAARFAGAFALVPWTTRTGSPAPGAIIDWQRETGPVVTAELPADLPYLRPIGARWLAWGSERSVVFRVGALGTFDVERELGPPPGSLRPAEVFWDDAAERVLLPFLGAPDEHRWAVLELSSETPSWQAGPQANGYPYLYHVVNQTARGTELLAFERTPSGLFTLSNAEDAVHPHSLLEAVDVSRARNEILGFADRTLAVSLAEGGSAQLLAKLQGQRAVRVGRPGDPSGDTELPLENGAERLLSMPDGWLSASLQYSNGCWNGPAEDDSVCLPAGNAALSHVGVEPPRLLSDTLLPSIVDASSRVTREWLEVVAQGEHVALLEHRGVRCVSESECNALGIPFEVSTTGGSGRDTCDEGDPECLPQAPEVVRQVSGYQNQRWLHPFEVSAGAFQAPLRLDDIDGYGYLGSDGLRVQGGAALSLLTPIEMDPDGVHVRRARIELLRFPSLDASGHDAMQRMTVPGFPLYVSEHAAVSIEPAAALGASGASVPVRVHRLALSGGRAYLEQTLELPSGHAGHLWANARGYVLLIGDDRCAEPSATLVSVRLNGDVLEEAGRITVPGTSWQLAQASDELVLLTRSLGDLSQHALLDVGAAGLSLRGFETRSSRVAISVFRDQVLFAP